MDYMKVLSLTGKNYIQLYINSIHSRNAIAKIIFSKKQFGEQYK